MTELRATHEGIVDLGTGKELPCAVLSNGERVIHARQLAAALGRGSRPVRGEGGFKLGHFWGAKNLKPIISQRNLGASNSAILYEYRTLNGQIAHGWRCDVIRQIVNIYLDARRAGVLRANQLHIAERCEQIAQALMATAIVKLIDEATGYQAERDATDMQRYFRTVLAEELQPWWQSRCFPRELLDGLARIYGMQHGGGRYPRAMGAVINWLIYDRLSPEVREEIQRRNPADELGNRRHRHHQWLSPAVGHPIVKQLIAQSLAIVRITFDLETFKRRVEQAMPKTPGQLVALAPPEQMALFGPEWFDATEEGAA